MLFKGAGHDRDLHIMDLALTLCSMVLSAYFGYVIGEGVAPLNWILATVGAVAAYGVSMWFKKAARNRALGYSTRYKRCLAAGFLCLSANIIFDFSSAAVLRDQVATQISNVNVRATNRETDLKIVNDEIASIKAQVAWSKPHKSEEAYRSEIRDLEGKADIMKRSKDCADQTRPDTKEHCQSLSSARGNLADLKQKVLLDARLRELEKKRDAAVAASEGTQHKSNPAVAVIRMVGAIALQKQQLSESEAFWTGLVIMLLMTSLINASLYSLATEIGELRAAELIELRGGDVVNFAAPRLDGPADAREPIPLRPVDQPSPNLVVINGREQQNTTANDQLRSQALSILAEVEARLAKSGFARKEGTA